MPAVGAMTNNIVNKLRTNPLYNKVIDEIIDEITEPKFNIESFLSNIEEKRNIIGKGTLNGLQKSQMDELSKEIKRLMHEQVSIHDEIDMDDYSNMVHNDFAQWIIKAERQYPIEIFTTNYDYLFEMGLENNSVPYFDGFVGSYQPFFHLI